MALKIKWSPLASAHLKDICAFISQDSETYAFIFAQPAISLVENIPTFPRSGRIVPEYNNHNIREHFYGDYRIVYRLKGSTVEIAAICHGTRLLKNVL